MKLWHTKKFKEQVARAERQAAEAREAAEESKERWVEVKHEAKKARQLREANGWTESIIDILGGRS